MSKRNSSVHSTHSLHSSGTHSAMTLTNMRNRLIVKNEPAELDFALDAFLHSLQLDHYDMFTDEEREEHLNKFDALDILNALQETNNDLATVKIENHYLKDFLQKNDPKLLIGLSGRVANKGSRNQAKSTAVSTFISRQSSGITLNTPGHPSLNTRSERTLTSNQSTGPKKIGHEYALNYRAKTEMAEKAAADVEKRIEELNSKATKEIRLLNGRIEELHLRTEETINTSKNFELHFLRDRRDLALLEHGTEKQLDRKLKKFVNNWIKNARALLGKMRLRITAMQEMCQQYRSDLITKTDLSSILGAVDFEMLTIKHAKLQQALDDKNAHMAGLKAVTGKASLAMSDEKQAMMAIEDESKRIANKTAEIIKMIAKLEREMKFVEESNKKDIKTLEFLRDQLEKYEAPSVNQYIEQKDELHALEKEEKMLQRKNYILNMKMSNLLKRCKNRDVYY